jgi:hypothetical protein
MGTILVEGGAAMPGSLGLEGRGRIEGIAIDRQQGFGPGGCGHSASGMEVFLHGGWDKEQATRRAVKRVLENVESQYCNCVEFTAVSAKSFLGMPYASVSGHSRHIQKSSAFTGYQQELTTKEKL